MKNQSAGILDDFAVRKVVHTKEGSIEQVPVNDSDITNKKDRILFRIFEILPGFLSISTLTFALVFSWSKPIWVAFFVILFDVYWTLKSLLSFFPSSCFF